MKRHSGFTLLELMVAIGIFALVSVIAYGSLDRLLNDRQRSTRNTSSGVRCL